MASLPKKPRDIKWEDLLQFARTDHASHAVRTTTLRPVERSFAFNLERLRWMLITPSLIGAIGFQMSRCASVAEFTLTNTIDADTPKNQRNEIASLAFKLFVARIEEQRGFLETEHWKSLEDNLFAQGTEPVKYMASSSAQLGMEAIIASSITTMWTLFETMASDLWEAAVNAHPQGLSELKGSRKRFAQRAKRTASDKTATGTSEEDATSLKSIDLDLIHRHGFDLREKMGTVLRRKGRFDSLGGIREAYGLAFFKDTQAIETALGDNGFDALSAVRNLLVHRSGIVDGTYDKQSMHLDIPRAPIGASILLDGQDTARILLRSVRKTIELLKAVDDWLVVN